MKCNSKTYLCDCVNFGRPTLFARFSQLRFQLAYLIVSAFQICSRFKELLLQRRDLVCVSLAPLFVLVSLFTDFIYVFPQLRELS